MGCEESKSASSCWNATRTSLLSPVRVTQAKSSRHSRGTTNTTNRVFATPDWLQSSNNNFSYNNNNTTPPSENLSAWIETPFAWLNSLILNKFGTTNETQLDSKSAIEHFSNSEETPESSRQPSPPSTTRSTKSSSPDMVARLLPEGYSIDTSRAKSNSNVVSSCCKKLNITEYPEGRRDGRPCDIYWHNIVYSDLKYVVKNPESRVNKFPGMTELAKKISLTHSIRSMRQLFPDEYDFYPNSWVIPAQLEAFQEYCQSLINSDPKAKPWFIVKPDDGAQGTGIYLISSPDQLTNISGKLLVQEYIDEPFLMSDKLKFDFRVYAVVKSINPLSIYIAREGMARFCTEKYEKPTSSNFENLYSHLTNYSLNKENSAYIHSRTLKDQLKGSKRLLSTVFHQMEAHGVRTRRLWHSIKMIIVKTVLAMVPEIMLNYEHYFSDLPGPQCFQIMGFDIIVRRDGVPILLEVNSAPSLSVDHSPVQPSINSNNNNNSSGVPVRSIVDEMIKMPLVRDTILLVLNQLDDVYKSLSTQEELSPKSEAEDDIAIMRKKRRPHLSEIFPARYGSASRHLLFLDKAVYLFMQFTSLRVSITFNLSAAKTFIKKCSLSRDVSSEDLEEMYAAINYYFTGKSDDITTGLPFHGFLQLLFQISQRKFNYCDDLLASMQRLLAYCDAALRHYGVRSARLKRAEVAHDENSNCMDIYLLPSRIKHQKSASAGPTVSMPQQQGRTPQQQRFDTHRYRTKQPGYNPIGPVRLQRARSLPRRIGPSLRHSHSTGVLNDQTSVLPRIAAIS